MTTQTITKSSFKSTLILSFSVLLACWGLFWLDYETKEVGDLFKIGNLVALLIYFVPTFLLSYLIYLFLLQKWDNSKSLFWSLIIGIPASFTLIILAFYLRNH
ncbi:MAG: hypothetical protein IPN61_14135 [Bacteroidetes bacterium]|nr:hypothetical protein [Bacteroidota bacterium]MBK8365434.1 hypothetical protein [Bacteroidota bacterium]MBK9414527.1 hypothetical protein [Bacteroidota bacterium]MBP6427380.1 hypothetical protein [Bacteroidia bacterium]MBP6656441.1 hypothetical protein [Bacteroidia bacterium]